MLGRAALVVAGLLALVARASAQAVSVQVAVCGQEDPALVPRAGVVPVVVTLAAGAEGASGPVLVEAVGYAGRRRAAWVLAPVDLPPGSRKAVEAFLPLEAYDLAVRAVFPHGAHGASGPGRGACRTRHVAAGLGPVAVFREPSEPVSLAVAQPVWPRGAELLWPEEGPPAWRVVEPDSSLLPRDPRALLWARGIAALGAPDFLSTHRDALVEYVRRGGRLLWAPGSSGMSAAPPPGLLPVEIAGEMREAPLAEATRFLGGFPRGPRFGPAVLWKPSAGRAGQVRASAGTHGLVVEETRGLGRVLAVGIPPGSRAARDADLAPGLVGWLVGPPPASVLGPRADLPRTEVAGSLVAPPADPVAEAALSVAASLPRPSSPARPVRLAAGAYALAAAAVLALLRRRPALAALAGALLAVGGFSLAAGPGYAEPRRAVAAAGFAAVEVVSGESRGRLEAIWIASAERGGALPLEGAPEDAVLRCLEAPLRPAKGGSLPLPAGAVTIRLSGTADLGAGVEASLDLLPDGDVRLTILNGTPWTLGSGLVTWRGHEQSVPAVEPGEGQFKGPLLGPPSLAPGWSPGLDHPGREGLRLAAHGAGLADPSPILLFELPREAGAPRPGLPEDRGEAWLVVRLPSPIRSPVGYSGALEGPEELPSVRCLPDGDAAALRVPSLEIVPAPPDEERGPVPIRAVHPLSGREIVLHESRSEDPGYLLDERGVLRLRLGDMEKAPWRTAEITEASSGWPNVRLRGRVR